MNDDKLSQLLRQWHDIEPAGNFEANVRRRIRLAIPSPTIGWLWRPAFVTAAIACSVLIGSSAGIFSASRPRQRAELQFMSAGTLAGGYARMPVETHR